MPEFRVRMFAYLKDRHGSEVEVQAEPTVAGVLKALEAAGVSTKACRLSVNLAFPQPSDPIREGDELGLIPAVSGG